MKRDAELINLDDFRTARDDGTPDDLNWLKQLGVGAIFSCQAKGRGESFVVLTYGVTKISDKYAYRLLSLDTKESINVNPIRFCNVFELYEVKRTREEFLQEERINNSRKDT